MNSLSATILKKCNEISPKAAGRGSDCGSKCGSKSAAVLALILASPASGATVMDHAWGSHLSVDNLGGYRVQASNTNEAQLDGSTIVARFAFFNDTIYGTGHSRLFGSEIVDGDTVIPFTIGVLTTLNAPRDADWWGVSAALPSGYSWGGSDGLVDEQEWGSRWIVRDAVPAPVPVPAAGLLLLAGLGALWSRARAALRDSRAERDALLSCGAELADTGAEPETDYDRAALAAYDRYSLM